MSRNEAHKYKNNLGNMLYVSDNAEDSKAQRVESWESLCWIGLLLKPEGEVEVITDQLG